MRDGRCRSDLSRSGCPDGTAKTELHCLARHITIAFDDEILAACAEAKAATGADKRSNRATLPPSPPAITCRRAWRMLGIYGSFQTTLLSNQFGVERRWRLTRTILRLPPAGLRLCGFTGTIFLPCLVLATLITSYPMEYQGQVTYVKAGYWAPQGGRYCCRTFCSMARRPACCNRGV